MTIRRATSADAPALLSIYAPYVERTSITFECDVPTVDEFRRRIEQITEKYPYIVAEADGEVVGYAYAHQLGTRAAYWPSVETSIYISMQHRRQGLGRRLYDALEEALRRQGVRNMYAVITAPAVPDEYSNHDSISFHQALGFAKCAHLHKCGSKFGHWYDVIWMEKIIGPHD